MERIYRACEMGADGQTESTAAFISRFFQLCLRAVCTPAATPAPEGPNNAGNQVVCSNNNYQPTQSGTQTPYQMIDPMQGPLIGFHDASYWCVHSFALRLLVLLLHADSLLRTQGVYFPGIVD